MPLKAKAESHALDEWDEGEQDTWHAVKHGVKPLLRCSTRCLARCRGDNVDIVSFDQGVEESDVLGDSALPRDGLGGMGSDTNTAAG